MIPSRPASVFRGRGFIASTTSSSNSGKTLRFFPKDIMVRYHTMTSSRMRMPRKTHSTVGHSPRHWIHPFNIHVTGAITTIYCLLSEATRSPEMTGSNGCVSRSGLVGFMGWKETVRSTSYDSVLTRHQAAGTGHSGSFRAFRTSLALVIRYPSVVPRRSLANTNSKTLRPLTNAVTGTVKTPCVRPSPNTLR